MGRGRRRVGGSSSEYEYVDIYRHPVPPEIHVPDQLVEQIVQGEAVIFLGKLFLNILNINSWLVQCFMYSFGLNFCAGGGFPTPAGGLGWSALLVQTAQIGRDLILHCIQADGKLLM